MEYNVLVVEDEESIRNAIEIYLKNQGYNVFKAKDGVEGLEKIENNKIHLVLADIMMPRMDGIQMVMKLRENYDFPVIMLNAKSEDIDKITGLNIGADDYITKPFNPMELLARVNSCLRRYSKYLKLKEGNSDQKGIFREGGLELNTITKDVKVDDEEVKLTPLEFKILELLIKNPGRVFSADEIYEKIWNEEAVATNTIMVHIRNIRQKIEIDSANPRYLKVVWGVGYKIEKQR